MDHLQNILSYFDQQQPLCAEHDRIPKDLYREFGVKAGLRDETGKGVLAGLTNISDIRAFQYVDGVKHPADGQLLYRGYDVKDLINGRRGSRFAFEEAGYLLLFGQLPTPEQLEQFCAVLGECRTMPTNFTRDVIMKAPSHDIMNSMARSVLTLASYFIGHYLEAGRWEIVNSPDGMSMAFLTLSMVEIFHSFNMRSRKGSIFHMKHQNKYLWGAMALSFVLTSAVIYIPALSSAFGFERISALEYDVAIGLGLLVIPAVEISKWIRRKFA